MTREIATLAALGGTATAYAALLSTPAGRRFTDRHTWATVVIGTAIVLFALRRLVTPRDWALLWIAFGVAGLPMIARSLSAPHKMKVV